MLAVADRLQVVLERGGLFGQRVGRVGVRFQEERHLEHTAESVALVSGRRWTKRSSSCAEGAWSHLSVVAVETVAPAVGTLQRGARGAVHQLQHAVAFHVDVGAAKVARQLQTGLFQTTKQNKIVIACSSSSRRPAKVIVEKKKRKKKETTVQVNPAGRQRTGGVGESTSIMSFAGGRAVFTGFGYRVLFFFRPPLPPPTGTVPFRRPGVST